jgi:hypothetical protein
MGTCVTAARTCERLLGLCDVCDVEGERTWRLSVRLWLVVRVEGTAAARGGGGGTDAVSSGSSSPSASMASSSSSPPSLAALPLKSLGVFTSRSPSNLGTLSAEYYDLDYFVTHVLKALDDRAGVAGTIFVKFLLLASFVVYVCRRGLICKRVADTSADEKRRTEDNDYNVD